MVAKATIETIQRNRRLFALWKGPKIWGYSISVKQKRYIKDYARIWIKGFLNQAVVIISKDDNLNKAHLKRLV